MLFMESVLTTENSPGVGGGMRGLREGLAALRGSESGVGGGTHRRSSWLAEDEQIAPPDQGDSRARTNQGSLLAE